MASSPGGNSFLEQKVRDAEAIIAHQNDVIKQVYEARRRALARAPLLGTAARRAVAQGVPSHRGAFASANTPQRPSNSCWRFPGVVPRADQSRARGQE